MVDFLTNIFRFFTQGDVDVASAYYTQYLPFFKLPEVTMMMGGFAGREGVHIDAYSYLLETLGMPVSWEGAGVAGIILFGIFSLFKGWIYPGRWVDKLLADKDAQIDKLTKSNEKLLAGQEPLVKLLETLNEEAKKGEDAT